MTSSMLTGTPTQTVQAFLAAFARHDVDAAIALTGPDVTVTIHPLGVRESGADALRQVLTDLVRGFPDLVISVSRVIATGDVVTALLAAEGTQAASYAGAINQEKHLDIDQAWRFVTIAYRTRELQLSHPDSGIGAAERSLWQDHEGWQPARQAVEYALVSSDWAEAFTALDLVLTPTLDDVLLTQLGEVAKGRGDDLTWLLTSFLAEDARRRGRWSRALADLAVAQRPENRAVLAKWIGRWSALADDTALGLGTLLEADDGPPAADVAAHARAAREQFLAGLLEDASGNGPAEAS
jgi:ketosteroid isomerase-like protein